MVLTIKPNLLCNAICDYCNVPELGKLIKPMNHETVDMILEKLEHYIITNSPTKVNVVFHGGEPLLAPDSFYKHVYNRFTNSDILKKTNIRYTIQTNLTLYHEKRLPHLMKLLGNKPLIGTSYDPISDSRKLGYKKSYEEEFMKSYFLLKNQGAMINIIYPVDKTALGREKEIYRYFKNLGIDSFTVKPVLDYDGDSSGENLFGEREYGEFLVNFYKEWEEDKYRLLVEPFNGWVVKHKTGNENQLSCYYSGRCSEEMFLVLPNGDIFECCEFTRIHQRAVGNIYKDDFVSLHDSRTKKVQNYTQTMKENACDGCQWWEYCHGGCPIKTHDEGEFGLHYFCESYKYFFSLVFQTPYVGEKRYINDIIKQMKEREDVV
jgi:uncharacterized protein